MMIKILGLMISLLIAKEYDLRIGRSGDPKRATIVIHNCIDEGDEEASFKASREKMRSLVETLNEWKLKLGDASPSANSPLIISPTSTGACSADIEDYIPPKLKDILNENPKRDGPNCWNAAAYFNGFIPSLRYTGFDEFTFWLNSPLCKRVPANSPRQLGDIMAIRSEEGSEVHGYIYLTDSLVFSKNGYNKFAPFVLTSEKSVRQHYDLQKEDPQCYHRNGPSEKCNSFAAAYRCTPLKKYLDQSKIENNSNLDTYWNYMDQLECYMSKRAMDHSSPLTSAHADTITMGIRVLEKEAKDNIERLEKIKEETPKIEQEKWLWQIIQERTKSLVFQLDFLKR